HDCGFYLPLSVSHRPFSHLENASESDGSRFDHSALKQAEPINPPVFLMLGDSTPSVWQHRQTDVNWGWYDIGLKPSSDSNQNRALDSCFGAFSLREPDSALPESAMRRHALTDALPASSCGD